MILVLVENLANIQFIGIPLTKVGIKVTEISSTPISLNDEDDFLSALYKQYLQDPNSVSPQWVEIFRRQEAQNSQTQPNTPASTENCSSTSPAPTSLGRDDLANTPPDSGNKGNETSTDPSISQPSLGVPSTPSEFTRGSRPTLARPLVKIPAASQVRSDLPPAPLAVAEDATTLYARREIAPIPSTVLEEADETVKIKGAGASVVKNMEASLSVPTATSVRSIPAKVLFDNRSVINNFLSSTTGSKVSFTHLVGYAMVEALAEMRELNVSYQLNESGKPTVVKHAHVNFGLAIDLPKADGTRSLVVPGVKAADKLDFAQFVHSYEALVNRARQNKLTPADFSGLTCTLTNPGGMGTAHSVPRLMNGQGLILGMGAMTYPAEFSGMTPEAIARLGISKVVTLTSTYDHRVIQGADSGQFLRLMEHKITGLDGFYDRVYSALKVPYSPVVWSRDIEYTDQYEVGKPARILELIHAYRSRGHLIADIDPITFVRRTHPDLNIENYGITLWDLDRFFPTGGFGGSNILSLRDILTKLRRAYCKQVGVEYMHIQDPAQRAWFQQHLETEPIALNRDEQMRILKKILEADAFETFIHTKFMGQKRFSIEGGESLIPLLDTLINAASQAGIESAAIGMAHRGRLNVLCNIAGKSISQVFSEFDGAQDPKSVQGSGDVKYHLGTEGHHTNPDGSTTRVYIAANPAHLEAVNAVIEGIVRGAQDRRNLGTEGYTVIPIAIHGDAALAGQGVVQETLNFSQLRGYTTGGTLHVVVNNQIGFTTSPTNGRSSHYPTDIAKGFQMPIFHVNGDYPDEVARVAKLAMAYRQEFHKDVFIDMVCYRRRGHNESDDPSMTQPVMYGLIEGKPTTFESYLQSLLGRGIISDQEATEAKEHFQRKLEQAFVQSRLEWQPKHNAQQVAGLDIPLNQRVATSITQKSTNTTHEIIKRIGDVHLHIPTGFNVHPKIKKLYQKRANMSVSGNIDWGFGELLAFGSLLMEGVPVRMSGEDVRRGTFVQRHATTHDLRTGKEWTPLQFLTPEQAKLLMYDSPLSEYAVMAFEYGYSLERPEALVIWEAQFGDFFIGAQTVVDEFISSAEQKWGQRSSLVLLLPHGYEGQGPDHSSARIERFLQISAERNWLVAQPSTPANYFHLLRAQAFRSERTPIVVFSPKQLLRRKAALSQIEEFVTGKFAPVIDDNKVENPKDVKTVLLCSGRIYYDLTEARGDRSDVALVRLEQLYPLPETEINEVFAQYEKAELVWVQDEPINQGAWQYVNYHLSYSQLTAGRKLRLHSRPASASTATGYGNKHKIEHEEILTEVFSDLA